MSPLDALSLAGSFGVWAIKENVPSVFGLVAALLWGLLLFGPLKRTCTKMRIWSSKARVPHTHEKDQNGPVDPDARPDFFCVGAQKGGTTWLYQQLAVHPDFWMPPLKEVNYFDQMSRSRHPDRAVRAKLPIRDERDRRFLQAMESLCRVPHIDLERYAQLFAPKASLLSGDISPAYCIVPEEIIACIVKFFPNLKVIFLARDPVERAWSDLSMAVRVGAVNAFDVTDHDEVTRNLLRPDIIMRSYPTTIIARWRRYIRPNLFRIYFFDDLERDPAEVRGSITRFLGADSEKLGRRVRADYKINEGVKKLPFPEDTRFHVARFFEAELKACAAELSGPASKWPARYGF